MDMLPDYGKLGIQKAQIMIVHRLKQDDLRLLFSVKITIMTATIPCLTKQKNMLNSV